MDRPFEAIFGTLMTLDNEATRLRSGDAEVIATLVERYQHRLYRYLLRLVSRPSTAEDLFQQTWVRAMERIRYYDPRRSFEGWLFAVAHNLAIDHLRKGNSEHPQEVPEDHPSEEAGPQETVEGRLTSQALQQALASLNETQREVIVLRFVTRLPIEQTAQALGKSQDAIKGLQRRGLAALRAALQETESL